MELPKKQDPEQKVPNPQLWGLKRQSYLSAWMFLRWGLALCVMVTKLAAAGS
jgi:hypothetical protein